MRLLLSTILILCSLYCVNAQTDQSLYNRKNSHHEWSYTGEFGPTHWVELDESYKDCGGKQQSPINIHPSKCEDKEMTMEFHYHPFFVDLVNNGHTLIEKIIEPKALKFNGESYTLLQFHFHTPSEHHINSREFSLEIHFVHQNFDGIYAVLGVLVEEGEHANHFLEHFMKSLPEHVNEELKSSEKADPMETFPKHFDKFYYYDGSLTTPPCSEGIHWIVLEEPVEATKEQIEAIHNIIKNDNRPLQEINDRIVYHTGN